MRTIISSAVIAVALALVSLTFIPRDVSSTPPGLVSMPMQEILHGGGRDLAIAESGHAH